MKTNKHVLSNQISQAGFSQRAENWITFPTLIFIRTSSQPVYRAAEQCAGPILPGYKKLPAGVPCKSDGLRIINLHTPAFIFYTGTKYSLERVVLQVFLSSPSPNPKVPKSRQKADTKITWATSKSNNIELIQFKRYASSKSLLPRYVQSNCSPGAWHCWTPGLVFFLIWINLKC